MSAESELLANAFGLFSRASMRPRFVERGKYIGEDPKREGLLASMRPRFVERGKEY